MATKKNQAPKLYGAAPTAGALTGYTQQTQAALAGTPTQQTSNSAPVYRQDGVMDEAAMRGTNTAVPYTGQAPNQIYHGVIGGDTVDLYGKGPQLTTEQAIERMNDSEATRFAQRIGQMPPEKFAALNPNATPEELADYKKLYDSYQHATLGGGKFGIRGWLNDHPVGAIAAFTALAYGGALAAGYGAGAAGGAGGVGGAGSAGGAVAGSEAAGSVAAGTAAGASGAGAGAGALGATSAAELAALPEIVVTGSVGGGLTAGEAAAIGAGISGAGAAASNAASSGAGSSSGSQSGQSGWSNTEDPVAAFQNTGSSNAEVLANNGGIGGGAGTGGSGESGLSGYINKAADLYDKYGGAISQGSSGMAKQPKGSTIERRDPWYEQAGQGALQRAEELSNRPYEEYTGQRVAPLSENEQLAGAMARSMEGRYDPMVSRLSQDFSAEGLSKYMNPYVDAVLKDRIGAIDAAATRERAGLDRNAAATDAFRSGRSDLARARLARSKMKSVDEATNETKAAAFESAKDAYFRQGSQDTAAIGAISGADRNTIGALSDTGATERSIRQAQADFNYGQFLERRDWNVNNLNTLLNAIGVVNPTAGRLTIGKDKKDNSQWGAVIGLLGAAVKEYYGSGG